MVHAIAFDTLKYTKRLEDAAIPRDQAEAQAAALSEVFDSHFQDLATKDDLQELETRTTTDIAEIKADIAGIKADIAGIKADISGMKTEIAEIKGEIRLNRWMLVLIIAVNVLPLLRALFVP